MKKHVIKKAAPILPVLESICNLAILPLSLASFAFSTAMITQELQSALSIDPGNARAMEELKNVTTDPNSVQVILVALLFFLSAARILHALNHREKGKAIFITTIVQGIVFSICAVIAAVLPFSLDTLYIAGIVYTIVISLGIIVSLVEDHRVRRLIPGILTIALLITGALSFVLVFALIAVWAFVTLLGFVFARLNLKMLQHIIRETYAAEIIFGLLILIFTFSYLLAMTEPNMTEYWDAVWYCFAIVTTIGFGDITAVTLVGRILSVILGIYGIVVVALITSIIVNFYGEMKKGGKAARSVKESGDPLPDAPAIEPEPAEASGSSPGC